MNFLELLILSLDPTRLYAAGVGVAEKVGVFITPTLLLLGVAVRTLETQLDSNSGLGKWQRFFRDIFLYGFFVGSYFGIMSLFNVLMNEIYEITHRFGSFDVLTQQMSEILKKANVGGKGSGKGTLDMIANGVTWLTDPFRAITTVFYWASNFFAIIAYVLLKVAHAVIYTFVFVYGLLAIPISVTSNFKVIKGWATLLGGTLLWPIVEGLLLSFIGVLFGDITDKVINTGGVMAYENDSGFKAFFTIMNVVIGALIIAAPFIARQLVANENAMRSLVTPFASGALAMGLGAISAGKSLIPGGKGASAVAAGMGMMGNLMAPVPAPAGYGIGPNQRSDSGGGGAKQGDAASNGPQPSSSGGRTSGGSSEAPMGASGTTEMGGSDKASPKAKAAPKASADPAQKARQKKAQKGHFINKWQKENPKPNKDN